MPLNPDHAEIYKDLLQRIKRPNLQETEEYTFPTEDDVLNEIADGSLTLLRAYISNIYLPEQNQSKVNLQKAALLQSEVENRITKASRI